MEENLDNILKAIETVPADDPNYREAVRNVLTARERTTPFMISELDDNEIFVFGCDVSGMGTGGASKLAHEEFEAEYGCGSGPTGRTYAITTTARGRTIDKYGRTVSIEDLQHSVSVFIEYARNNPDKTFYVTRIGAGNAGFKDVEVAEMFKPALQLKNVFLPHSFLNVLFGVKCDFESPSQLLPIQSKGVKDFRRQLDFNLSLYQMWVRDKYGQDPVVQGKKPMKTIEYLSDAISESIDMMYRGMPARAYDELCKGLEQKYNDVVYWKLKLDIVNSGKCLYRIRKEADNWEKKNVDKNGMFHIPFSLRQIVKTQRYSIPGYPSLYVSDSIYGCWEELGRPNLGDCLVSRLSNTHQFRVANLCIPDVRDWYEDYENRKLKSLEDNYDLIVSFPLIMACTFRVSSNSASFKPEYIVPQLLLQYVKEEAYKTSKQMKSREIYGIKYTSVNVPPYERRNSGDWNDDMHLYENYVIPVISIKNERCHRLCELFEISDPVCEEYELINKQSVGNGYMESRFGRIESVLKEKTLKRVSSE